MSDPSKILPFVRKVLPAAFAAVSGRVRNFPRFAREASRPAPLPVLGFGIPGGMRDERPRR